MRAWIVLLMVLFLVYSAAAVPVRIEKVEVDDVELAVGQVNRLDVIRDNEIEVELLLSASQDTEVEIEAFISGFEYNDVSPLSARTTLVSLDANVSRKFTLPIRLDEEVEEDNYKLRIMVTDRDGEVLIQNYNLKIDVERHDLNIEDVVFTPSGSVTAGQALLATARIENQGEIDEDDVKVTVTITGLGVSGTDFIDEIEADEEEETEEIFMRVPLCAKEGVYDAEVTASYDEDHRTTRRLSKVKVEANPQCEAQKRASESVQVVTPANGQPLKPAETTPAAPVKSRVRSVLETLVLILVGLLIIVVLIIGFNKLKKDEDEEL